MPRLTAFMIAFSLLMSAALFGADEKPKPAAYLTAEEGGPDFGVQGEYLAVHKDPARTGPSVQVIALGDGKFDAIVYQEGLPGSASDGSHKSKMSGKRDNAVTRFTGDEYSGEMLGSRFTLKRKDGPEFKMQKVTRGSPTLGAQPPPGAIVLFDGSGTPQWKEGKLEDGKLLGVGARTNDKFKDYSLHLEFRTPFMPTALGQARGNSGMYLNDQYECQILDSFGLTGENNECGGIYQIAKPKLNMCLPPLSWQTYDADFKAAKFDASGKKTAPATLTLRHNGVTVHNKLELPKNTAGGGESDESHPGALFLQDHGNPVRFRNIWIVPAK